MTIDTRHEIDPALKVIDAKHCGCATRPDGKHSEH
jgi:hypothetical protein